MDSAVQRAARLSDAAFLRGGFVSHPNSVTQNWTGWVDVVRVLRLPERAAERVRVVRPGVEVHGVVAGRVRVGALRETEKRAHERERRDGVPLLLLALLVPERVERTGENEVRWVDGVHRLGDGVDHRSVATSADGVQVEAQIGFVPDLVDVLGRHSRREPVVVGRESRREITEGGDVGGPGVHTLRPLRVPPRRRRDDIEDRRQPCGIGILENPVDPRPAVAG
jgi:hypothetical protein